MQSILDESIIKSNLKLLGQYLIDVDLESMKDKQKLHLSEEQRLSSVKNVKQALLKLPKVSSSLSIKLDLGLQDEVSLLDKDELQGTTDSAADNRLLKNIGYDLKDKLKKLPDNTVLKTDVKAIAICGLHSSYFLKILIDWCVTNGIQLIAFVDINPSGLVSSALVSDWSEIRNKLTKNEIKSQFFFHNDIAIALSEAITWFSKISYYSCINFHYFVDRISNNHCLDVVNLVADKNAYAAITGKGFIEDNYNMVINTVNSLDFKSSKFYQAPDSSNDFNIILVASGPSLDQTIPELKKIYKDKSAIIISCGSSVTSLIENDIIPDYSILVERNPSVYIKHRDQTKYHKSFKKIKLVASTTVDHRIFKYYKSVTLYTRTSNIYAALFPKPNRLPHTHPTSANAGISFALSLRPKNIILFGLDFGTTNKLKTRHDKAHGKGSYKITNAVKGSKGTMFTNSALLRACHSFNMALLDSEDNFQSKILSRSISPLGHPVEHISKEDLDQIFELNSNNFLKELPVYKSKLDIDTDIDFTSLLKTLKTRNTIDESLCPITSYYTNLRQTYAGKSEFKLIHPLIVTATLGYSTLMANKQLCSLYNQKEFDELKDILFKSYLNTLIKLIFEIKELI